MSLTNAFILFCNMLTSWCSYKFVIFHSLQLLVSIFKFNSILLPLGQLIIRASFSLSMQSYSNCYGIHHLTDSFDSPMCRLEKFLNPLFLIGLYLSMLISWNGLAVLLILRLVLD